MPNENRKDQESANHAKTWNCDSIVLGGSTATKLLRDCGLLPKSWTIPPAEWIRIRSQNIFLTVTSLPATTLILGDALKNLDSPKLVVVELSLVKAGKLSAAEAIAMLLHEIGHIVNPPNTDSDDALVEMAANDSAWIQRQETCADDYARHCGYGDEIVSGLEKLANLQREDFATDEVRRRIERIKKNDQLNLNLLRTVS
jgi:Zn-dependent protease with chaperone function